MTHAHIHTYKHSDRWKRERHARAKNIHTHMHAYTHAYVFAIRLWVALLLIRKILSSRGRQKTNDLALNVKNGNGTLQREKTIRK